MQSQTPVDTELHCTQCGGELHPDEGQIFLTCPFCGATVYLDKSRVVFHWYVAPTLSAQDAQGALFRWMSGSQTVKDLDQKARVVSQTFQFFPLWYFKYRTQQGEEVALQPAAATSVTELHSLKLPAGDLRKYESSLDSQSQAPTVPLEAGLEWLKNRGLALSSGQDSSGNSPITEMAMVHVPVFLFKYQFGGQAYTAIVDAASGTVLANLYPHKAEVPYLLVGGVAAVVYLCLAIIPLVGASIGSGSGIAFGICVGAGVIVTPILFAWALWVASKI
jgi:predicted RNA-binding Zn-ribbon protein involved in translation (DUF1610 family)